MARDSEDKTGKKAKKAKRSATDGVTMASKKQKKDKKEKKKKISKKLAEARGLDEKVQAAARAPAWEPNDDENVSDSEEEEGAETTGTITKIEASLVPFAVPIADEKHGNKVLKCVRKSAKAKTLKRGVKEVVKALRKSPPAAPSKTDFPGVVIIAGDVWPLDVISHLPVLCEDHNVPYMFVASRAELGAASATKRPTSVVMVCEKSSTKKEVKSEDAEGFREAYKELVQLVQKQTLKQTRV